MKYYQWHRPLGPVYAALLTRHAMALAEQQPRHIEFVQDHPKGDYCIQIMDENALSNSMFTKKKNQRSPRYGYQRHRKTSSVHGEDIPSEGHK